MIIYIYYESCRMRSISIHARDGTFSTSTRIDPILSISVSRLTCGWAGYLPSLGLSRQSKHGLFYGLFVCRCGVAVLRSIFWLSGSGKFFCNARLFPWFLHRRPGLANFGGGGWNRIVLVMPSCNASPVPALGPCRQG